MWHNGFNSCFMQLPNFIVIGVCMLAVHVSARPLIGLNCTSLRLNVQFYICWLFLGLGTKLLACFDFRCCDVSAKNKAGHAPRYLLKNTRFFCHRFELDFLLNNLIVVTTNMTGCVSGSPDESKQLTMFPRSFWSLQTPLWLLGCRPCWVYTTNVTHSFKNCSKKCNISMMWHELLI